MATFDRSQLHKQVLASNSFKLFLELEPQLRDVIINFYESKYGKCLKQLDDMKDNLMLDTYLASHVNNLLSMIRSRSLVQYFRYVLMSVTWCDLQALSKRKINCIYLLLFFFQFQSIFISRFKANG